MIEHTPECTSPCDCGYIEKRKVEILAEAAMASDLERFGRYVGEQDRIKGNITPIYCWGLDIPEPVILPSGDKVYIFSAEDGRGMKYWYDMVGRYNGWEGVDVQRDHHNEADRCLRII